MPSFCAWKSSSLPDAGLCLPRPGLTSLVVCFPPPWVRSVICIVHPKLSLRKRHTPQLSSLLWWSFSEFTDRLVSTPHILANSNCKRWSWFGPYWVLSPPGSISTSLGSDILLLFMCNRDIMLKRWWTVLWKHGRDSWSKDESYSDVPSGWSSLWMTGMWWRMWRGQALIYTTRDSKVNIIVPNMFCSESNRATMWTRLYC